MFFFEKDRDSRRLDTKKRVYIFGENVCRILDTIYFIGRFLKRVVFPKESHKKRRKTWKKAKDIKRTRRSYLWWCHGLVSQRWRETFRSQFFVCVLLFIWNSELVLFDVNGKMLQVNQFGSINPNPRKIHTMTMKFHKIGYGYKTKRNWKP